MRDPRYYAIRFDGLSANVSVGSYPEVYNTYVAYIESIKAIEIPTPGSIPEVIAALAIQRYASDVDLPYPGYVYKCTQMGAFREFAPILMGYDIDDYVKRVSPATPAVYSLTVLDAPPFPVVSLSSLLPPPIFEGFNCP